MLEYVTIRNNQKVLGTLWGSDYKGLEFRPEFPDPLNNDIQQWVESAEAMSVSFSSKVYGVIALAQEKDPSVHVASLVSATSPVTVDYRLILEDDPDSTVLLLAYEDNATGEVYVRQDGAWVDPDGQEDDILQDSTFVYVNESIVEQYDKLGSNIPFKSYSI